MIRVNQAQAARFVLKKNDLDADKSAHITDLIESLIGLPSELMTTPFLSAYVRVDQFEPNHLLDELYGTRNLIRSILMRGVNYVVRADSFVTWHVATARQRNQEFNSQFRLWGIEDNEELERLGKAIVEVLNDQPATAQKIAERLPQNLVKELTQTSRGGRVSKINNVKLALRWLCARGILCAGQEAPQDWRTENVIYAPLGYWYPGLDLSTSPTEAEAQTALVQAYLAAFGPATEADISFWTGFGKSETARAMGALSGETTLVLIESLPGTQLILKRQVEALQATAVPAEPVVNVLPADDPYVTAHRASRLRYFTDQKLQRRVFSGSGAVKPTILVDGQIVGVWAWQADPGQDKITWQLLTGLDSAIVPLVNAEIKRIGAFVSPKAVVKQAAD